jgi:DNA-binding response OmpR family regulator
MKDGKTVILCIDDDPDILSYLRIVLESEGYVMAEAPSAEEGLRAYREKQPDLVIVDLMMEEVDAGTNFVRELRVLGNKAPILMLSSTGDNLAMAVDTTELGLASVLQKPVSKDRLIALIKAKLG